MSTIGDLCVTSSVSSDDKLPIWQNANGVTRALPISVLDSRYLTQADVALLAASATVETFVAGVDFTPGVSLALTLANQYYSTANIEVFFDAAFQGPDQYSLAGLGLVFVSPIPVGVQNVYVRGGAARLVGTPSDGTVTTVKIVDGAVTLSKLASQSVNDSKIVVGSKLYNRITDIVSVKDFGAVGDGVNNDTAAVQAAFAFMVSAGGGRLRFPAGTYRLTAQCVFTFLADGQSILLEGDGPDRTTLSWLSGGGGTTFNYKGPFNAVHIRDMSFVSGQVGVDTAIKLVQTIASYGAPANSAISDISNVVIRGSDGYQANQYWNIGIDVHSVSNINFTNLFVAGLNNGAGYVTVGTGVSIQGTAAVVPVVFNFLGSTFNGLNIGIVYGTYAQGVSINQCNFTGGSYGVVTQGTLLDQFNCYGSQFNVGTVGIQQTNYAPQSMISNNLFIVPNAGTGISFTASLEFNIIGNNFISMTPTTNNGIVVAGTVAAPGGLITGNTFVGFTGSAIFLQSTSNHINVQSNIYASNAANVTNSGTSNTVGGGSI